MTREEVKEQLARNPLEWMPGEHQYYYGYEYLKAEVKGGELRAEYRIFFDYERDKLLRVSLYLIAIADRDELGECVMRKVSDFPTLEEVKAKAEAHRLDLACRMLGVRD